MSILQRLPPPPPTETQFKFLPRYLKTTISKSVMIPQAISITLIWPVFKGCPIGFPIASPTNNLLTLI